MRILQVGTNRRSGKTSRRGLVIGLVLTALAVLIAAGAGGGVARAADAQHGISVTKGCVSPTQIGAALHLHLLDPEPDRRSRRTRSRSTALVDTVHASGGDVSSGNVFSSLRLIVGQFAPGFSTPPTCAGPAGFSGDGSPGNPWVGATKCTLPFGSRIGVLPFSFYTVKAADFNLPATPSGTRSSVGWHDLCNGRRPGPAEPGRQHSGWRQLQPRPAGFRRRVAGDRDAAPVDDRDHDPQRRARAGHWRSPPARSCTTR